MILVLSSQRFSPLILVSDGNVFSVISTFHRISHLQNVSPYVSLKGPAVSSYDVCLHVCRFTQFFILLLSTFFYINCYVHTIISLPSISFYITSSRFSVCKQVRRFIRISLAFSTFLCTLACSHNIVLLFLRFSVCQYIRTISRHCMLSFSLYLSMFIRYQSCLLNVYPYICAILVVSFTFLRNLLSHCISSVCPFGVLLYVTHVLSVWNQFCLKTFLRKLVVAYYFISLCILVRWQHFSLLQCISNQHV